MTVRAAIASRIDALPPEPRAALLAASVVGKYFWRGVAPSARRPRGGRRGVDALESSDLIRREPSSQRAGDARVRVQAHPDPRGRVRDAPPRGAQGAPRGGRSLRRGAWPASGIRNLAWVLAHHWREAGEPDDRSRT